MSRICLNMIVKDEAPIVERCLLAAAPWIDCYWILDTGSTDGTPDIIRRFMAAVPDGEGGTRTVEGIVEKGPFESFKSARNRALAGARASALDFEHLLLLDADMVLVVKDGTMLRALPPERRSFSILQAGCGVEYDNVRLLRRDAKAFYEGRTHEVIMGAGDADAGSRVHGVTFDDRGDGSSHAEKFTRDVKLLLEDLKEKPGDARATFYLAETYRNHGQPHNALPYYRKRAASGGFEEEAWFAQLCIVRCLIALQKSVPGALDEALVETLKAFERRPWRAEPLVEMARAFREAGRNELATILADRAAQTTKPVQDSLFVNPADHHWGGAHEMSIAGYYSSSASIKAKGKEACLSLSVDPTVPGHIRDQARENSKHWTMTLGTMLAAELGRDVPYQPVQLESGAKGWAAMNPSVATAEGMLFCVLRHVNYVIEPNGAYTIKDGTGIVTTRNEFLQIEHDTGRVLARQWIRESTAVEKARVTNGARVQGWEDMRLFWSEGRKWRAIATTRDRSADGVAQMALLEMGDQNTNIERVFVQANRAQYEKNWAPILDPSFPVRFQALYSTHPTIVLRSGDPEQRMLSLSERSEPRGLALHGLRGGSQVVRVLIGGKASETGVKPVYGYLCVNHEAFEVKDSMRVYTHRFVLFDEEMRVLSVSDPFTFGSGESIEFCAGLAVLGEDVWLSYGARDARGCVVRVPLEGALRAAGKRRV